MKMIPHSHFGMSGPIQRHTLVYTVVMASALAVFFDLGQIASLGAFFYLIMDMMVHWGSLPLSTQGNRGVSGIAADGAFVRRCGAGCFHRDEARQRSSDPAIQRSSDPAIVVYALIGIVAVFGFERWYLSRWVAPAAD
ncbi:MAG: hypothetical protein ACI802_000722 [Candidatus Paceibacteria bacterium]|jgi:hypothetical protein